MVSESIGIKVTGFDETSKSVVDQLLRLVTADAPSDVRCEALRTLTHIAQKPVNISNCTFLNNKPKKK